MIKIAIVDDEEKECQTLERFFQDFQKEVLEEFEIDLYSSGEEFLSKTDQVYDLICLDIEMKELDGIETAKVIRKRQDHAMIIFITNLAQMAIKGYEVQAFDFVLKPLNYYSFTIKMRNIVEILRSRKSKNIVIHSDGMVRKISTEEILYVEVQGHHLFFYTHSQVLKQKAPLKELERKLEGLSFKRCNHCYLVNLQYVSAVNKDEVKVGDTWLKISRPRKKEFLQSLTNYMGGIL